MGDRGNVVVRDPWPDDINDREAVFLYSHWGGQALPETLRLALDKAEPRWSDPQYLARIVFETMVEGRLDTTTGFGISTRLADNEHDLLVLCEGRVYRLSEEAYQAEGFRALDRERSLSFAMYVAAKERSWDNLLKPVVTNPVA
jgi:hypothetical protein